MSTIILKHGVTSPEQTSGAGFIGEPLFYYDLANHTGELWMGMGKSGGTGAAAGETSAYPIKIGGHPSVTLANGTNTTADNTAGQKSITSTSGYAITGLSFDNNGHLTSANATAIPSAYVHPNGGITVTSGSHITGSTPVSGQTDTYLTATADQNYAIGGVTIDATGHLVGVSAIGLPTVSWTPPQDTTGWTPIGTLTINGTANTVLAPTGGTSTSVINNLTAEQPTNTNDAALSTLLGDGRTVTFVEHVDSANGTTVQYEVGEVQGTDDKTVTATVIVNVINGGTW